MGREPAATPISADMSTHERLDAIAAQIQNVAGVVEETIDALRRGEIGPDELRAVTNAADLLVRAWELQADIIRRRPR